MLLLRYFGYLRVVQYVIYIIMEVKKYIQENEERFLSELESLIRIPSISAKAEHKADIAACAERWKELLLEAGADRAEVILSIYGAKRSK